MKMKISKVRDVIDGSYWRRLDLSGHTREEFMRCNVPEVLGRIIEALKALEIAARFTADRERRDSELMYCGRSFHDGKSCTTYRHLLLKSHL